MQRMILVSHGGMAEGVKNSMEMVAGSADGLLCFGLMPGQEPGELAERIEKIVESEPEQQFIILADIRGGSVSNSMTRLLKRKNVKLINGMNLALAIGLYLTDGALSDGRIREIIEEAKDGIGLSEEDFSVQEEEII